MIFKLTSDIRKTSLFLKVTVFSPGLTDLQAGPVHIYASSIAGNWKKWVIILRSRKGITAKHYGSKFFLNWTLNYYCMPKHRHLTPLSSERHCQQYLWKHAEKEHTEVVWGDKRPELALLGAELCVPTCCFHGCWNRNGKKVSVMWHVLYKCGLSQPSGAM